MMMMTMTVIVMMSCGNSTFYVLIERTFTSQNAFCHCLYFLFSYKRSAALGQFVIHRGLIISVMQVGMLCILTSRTPCAERVDKHLPRPTSWAQEFFSGERRYWKDKTLWQLKRKKNQGRGWGRGRIPTAYLSSFLKQGRVHLGVFGLDLSFNQFFQRLKIWRAASDIRPSCVTSRPETNSEGFWEQI